LSLPQQSHELILSTTGVRTPKLDAKQTILTAQFIQQRLGVFQVASIEALGEPAVDFGEHRARLVATVLFVGNNRPRAIPAIKKTPGGNIPTPVLSCALESMELNRDFPF
jgi:hypothetical protein